MSTRKRIEAPAADLQEVDDPFHVKYRPRSLNDVVGQSATVKSLRDAIKKPTKPHAFLFTGPSGCGKTTLSRIIAESLGCETSNVMEVDAASNSGLEAMKEVMSTIRYQGFGSSPNRAIIIDECHALSKQAWTAMLKPIEEPPAHVFFFLCTTETGKVPETIVTRCHASNLKPVRYDDIMDLIEKVADAEKLKTPDRVLQMVGRACSGSPRQALVMLSMVQDFDDEDEAARVLEVPLESKEVIDLCRMMMRSELTWDRLVTTLKAMPETSPESTRIVITNYLGACAMGAKSEKEAMRILDLLRAFSKPFNASDKIAPLLLAFDSILFD